MLLIDNDTVYGEGILDTIIGLAKKFGPSLLQSAAKSAASEAGKQLASKVFSPTQSSPAIGPQMTIPTAQPLSDINNRLDEIINKHRTGVVANEVIPERSGGVIEIQPVDNSKLNAIDIRDYIKARRGAGIKYV